MLEIFASIWLLVHVESWDSEIFTKCEIKGDKIILNHGYGDDFTIPNDGESVCIKYEAKDMVGHEKVLQKTILHP